MQESVGPMPPTPTKPIRTLALRLALLALLLSPDASFNERAAFAHDLPNVAWTTCQTCSSSYDAHMDPLVGTRNCPHVGFEAHEGRPCCRADELVRHGCGLAVPNPKAQTHSRTFVTAEHFCTVLGRDAIPAEALRLDARDRAEAARKRQPRPQPFRPPGSSRPRPIPEPPSSYDPETDQPVIPTHTLRHETQRPSPNAPCPCGSGRKYKKCCGRG